MHGRQVSASRFILTVFLLSSAVRAAVAPKPVLAEIEAGDAARLRAVLAALCADPATARCYTFTRTPTINEAVPDLGHDRTGLRFVPWTAPGGKGKPLADATIVPGPWPGTRAARLDRAWFESEPFEFKDRRVTVACRLRLLGPGTLQRDGTPGTGTSGTVLSVSSGYYDGWRLTISPKYGSLTFALGTKEPGAGLGRVQASGRFESGRWMHVAVTWDGTVLRLFVNGAEAARSLYGGPYLPATKRKTFRVGYAGYGVGSVRQEIADIVLVHRVLSDNELLKLANPARSTDQALARRLAQADAARRAGQTDTARGAYRSLIKPDLAPDDGTARNAACLARLGLADLATGQDRLEEARHLLAALRDDNHAPEHYRMQAWLRLADTFIRDADYATARRELRAMRDAATGHNEFWRMTAVNGLRELRNLAQGVPFRPLRVRRIERTEHPAREFWVATDGAAGNPGSKDRPFATLEQARDAVRALRQKGPLPSGGVTVWVRPGSYVRRETFELNETDSGALGAPVVYRAATGGTVRLAGGAGITRVHALRDPQVRARIPENARSKVLVADLKQAGVSDFGTFKPLGYARKDAPLPLQLFYNGRPLHPARWPNTGFVPIHDLPGTKTTTFRGHAAEQDGCFVYRGDRPKRWLAEKDPWLMGYWSVKYAAQYEKVRRIDPVHRTIEMEKPYPSYGVCRGWLWYGLNLLSELDAPGEMYVDRERGLLLFIPPGPVEGAELTVSVLEDPAVVMEHVSNVVLRGFRFEAFRGPGVLLRECSDVTIAGCTLAGIGNWAVRVEKGQRNAVVGCDLRDLGSGGIYLGGGDRRTLTPAENLADNNAIVRFNQWIRGYRPGIMLDGVGQRAVHNLLYDSPHAAVMIRQNDHEFGFNEVHDVVYEASEMGAVYTWGGGDSFSWRGTVLHDNYFHHLRLERYPEPVAYGAYSGGVCIHIDALNGAMTLVGNVFRHLSRIGIANGGGRDNLFANNLFFGCDKAIMLGDRTALYPHFGGRVPMDDVLARLPYRSPPWSVRYPRLVHILDDDPGQPKHNVIERNVCYGGGWLQRYGLARKLGTICNNWTHGDPGFVDAAHGDIRLRPDAPVVPAIGFDRIAWPRIGLYQDPLRASWPVEHPAGIYPNKMARRRPGNRPVCMGWPLGNDRITVDGLLSPGEWLGLDPSKGIVLEQDPEGRKGAGPPSRAWVRWGARALYVGVMNEVVPGHPLLSDGPWGSVDSTEIAIEGQHGVNTRGWWMEENLTGPVFFLIGAPSGRFDSLCVAGLPEDAAGRARRATQYAAHVVDLTHWSCEWRIPLAAVCVDPSRGENRPFNIGIRKTAGPAKVSDWVPGKGPVGWVVWIGTGAQNWCVWDAGTVKFAKSVQNSGQPGADH